MTADKAYKERYMRIICEDEKIVKGFEIFTKRFTLLAEKTVRAAKSEDGKTSAELLKDGNIEVRYADRLSFFRSVFDLAVTGKTPEMNYGFKDLGIMLDCARNGVPTVDFLKDYILSAVASGYTYLGLYVEDCLEVEGEPKFGYMRGRYTEKEIKEIVAYADLFGFEIVPFVQTLAHLEGLFRHWDPYVRYARDCCDILLMDESFVYQLIDRLFDTVERTFGKGRINIGMDEAFLMTFGKYRTLHADYDRAEVFSRHAAKVCELAEKHGLTPEAWADMFVYHKDKVTLPDNLYLRVWDYYHTDEKTYIDKIEEAKKLTGKVKFASGASKWYGFAPHNEYSMKTIMPSIEASKGRTDDFLLTLWGDDGAECSHNAVWYSLIEAANAIYGEEFDKANLDKIAETLFGYNMEELLAFDLPNNVFDEKPEKIVNPSKYLLYEDVFTGNADFTASEGFVPYFAKNKKTLERLAKGGGRLKDMYAEYAALCAVLEKKCGIRNRLRLAYKNEDKKELVKLAKELKAIAVLVEKFEAVYLNRWLSDNKPFGSEIIQIRTGGLINRLNFCAERVEAFAGGKIRRIEELEQEDLSPTLRGDNYTDARLFCSYEQNVSYCILSHKFYG